MRRADLAKALCVFMLLTVPAVGRAERYEEAHNGATCIPYPPFNATNAVPYSHFLYGFRQSAYCHFPTPNGWNPANLSYVLFTGSVASGAGPMRVRLCVHSGTSTSCGPEGTLEPGSTGNWVAPPSPVPAYATGAYLSVLFPTDRVSVLRQFFPVWYR